MKNKNPIPEPSELLLFPANKYIYEEGEAENYRKLSVKRQEGSVSRYAIPNQR
jgi:hypothetical protein